MMKPCSLDEERIRRHLCYSNAMNSRFDIINGRFKNQMLEKKGVVRTLDNPLANNTLHNFALL